MADFRKGGYSLVDCTGLDLGDLKKVNGIYDKMKTAYEANKLVILTNVVNGSAKFTPMPVFLAMENTVVVLTIMNLPYRISSDDTIVQA